MLFDVAHPPSVDILHNEVLPEIRDRRLNVPIILVANKIDLRGNPDAIEKRKQRLEILPKDKPEKLFYEPEDVKELAEKIGAAAFVEVSALYGQGMEELMTLAIKRSLNPPPKPLKEESGKCTMM